MAFSTLSTYSSNTYIPKTSSPINRRHTIRCSSSPISTQFDIKTYWTALIKEIDQKLNDAVPLQHPKPIHESMRYSLLADGAKRAPTVMCVSAFELFGGNRVAAMPTACALEMVHAASLVHNELPCMDDAPSRRDQPSNHSKFGVNVAILTGDSLFTLGFRHIVAQTPTDIIPHDRLVRVITEIARTFGSTGMAAGRFLDLEFEPNTANFVREKKFGEMGQCSAACGGLLAGASDDEIQRLRKYGKSVGVLYQIVDDVLEAKTDGERKKEGKSYVSVHGVERAMEVAEGLRSQAKKELDGLEKYGDNILPLHSFVDYAVDRGSIDW
ncbi:Geranylgeranyl pyrophosphate synthase/Polyprenyl synthetase [Handroanthus impetiginosus]|uniref:Geranylgeranyl pyrophosphate synthase/Polyprenyl synthetase n=1 Tax=Handroanthus impetiginosus TaxID=429701 RepID=A0A2G9FYG4_9LAMI|nr:Geranylgeranyl pyrophosphate synthase/Polyprenyl synthetase [Handroanthus impetiginosus]